MERHRPSAEQISGDLQTCFAFDRFSCPSKLKATVENAKIVSNVLEIILVSCSRAPSASDFY